MTKTKIPLFGSDGLFSLVVIVSALGYFVDVYDLVLFSTVRTPSLRDIGVSEADFFSKGVLLLNIQMAGMLAGGLLWGIIGDKQGRLTILFGSILMYSVANLANAYVTSLDQYAVLRFIAGFGLAGEIGGAVTLVSESMKQSHRGLGTTLIAAIGLTGAIAAGFVAKFCDWRTAYTIGGVLGLMLLVLRVKVFESGMFENLKEADVPRGSLKMLVHPKERFIKYLSCCMIGVPLYFGIVIFMTFAPEISKSLGATEAMTGANAVIFFYSGTTIGGFFSGILSQKLQSRKTVVALALMLMSVACTAYLFTPAGMPVGYFEWLTFLIGLSGGYAAVFFMIAAEQFGTNIRALATTSITNFFRAASIPISGGYIALKDVMPLPYAALSVGAVTMALAFFALTKIDETFHKDLDHLER
ncbi:MAG: MFS transporter [Alphaproteobacteria bacterium]|nr:MFS transporter [Alphaproteobacteria bacterium]